MIAMIGRRALGLHDPVSDLNGTKDYDVVGTYNHVMDYVERTLTRTTNIYPFDRGKKYFISGWSSQAKSDVIIEAEIAWPDSNARALLDLILNDPKTIIKDGIAYASLDVLYMLKMSHRYLRNSPHFLKTMKDIHRLRTIGAVIRPDHMEFFKERERMTYDYSHPKLNVKKDEFFKDDGISYVFDHDSIHEAVKHLDKPAYTYFKPESEEVLCSKKMFWECEEHIRLNAVLEESYVLALERSQIPFKNKPELPSPKKSFEIALMKVCTSITSGWFREYAWENYYKVLDIADDSEYNYVDRFWNEVSLGRVKSVQ